MSEESLLFTIGAKDSASSAIKKINNNLKYLDKEYNSLAKNSKNFESSQEGLAKKLEYLGNKYEQTKQKTQAYSKQLEEAKQKADQEAEKLEKLKKSFNMEEAISKSEAKIQSYQAKIDKTSESIEKEKAKLESLKSAEGNNAEAIAKSEEKLSKYQARLEKANASMDKEKQHLESLKSGHADNTSAVEKSEKALNRYQEQMTKAEQNIKLTENELKGLTTEINETNTALKNKVLQDYTSLLEKGAKGITSFGGKLSNIGSGITEYGQNLSAVSAGVTAIGVAATAAYRTVKGGMDNVIKATGATGDAAKDLEETYHNIGRNSAADWGTIGNTLGEVNTRFGYTGQAAEKCTNQFIKFAKINNTDATQSVSLVARAMGDAGVSADHYSEVLDMLSVAAQQSGIDVGKLSEMLVQFGAPMRNLGFDMKDSIALFATWEKAGVNTATAFSGMKKAISVWGKSGKDATKEFSKTVQEIKNAKSPAEATTKAIAAFGQKAGPDLADAIQGGRFNVDEMTKALDNCGGAVDKTAGQMADGTAEATKRLHEGQIALADLGKTIVSNSVPFLKDMTAAVKEVTKWYNGLSDSTKETIVKLGGLIAIAGPVVTGIGKMTSTVGKTISAFGKLIQLPGKIATGLGKVGKAAEATETGLEVMQAAQVGATASSTGLMGSLAALGPAIAAIGAAVVVTGGAFYACHEYDKLLNGSILDSTDNMNLLQKALVDVTGMQRYSNEALENMGLKYKEFSSDIAPETQQSMEDVAGKFRDIQTEIDKVDISGAITDEEKNDLVSKTDDLCNTIKQQLSNVQSEAYNKLKETFNMDGVIDENEQKILDSMDSGGKQIQDKVQQIQNEIHELEQQGALDTVEGRAKINTKLLQLQDIYAEELKAKEKANRQDIQAFRDEASSLDLQGAIDLMSQKAQVRDQEIEQTKGKYDESIALLKAHLEECSGEEAEATQKEIDILEDRRSKELDSENQKYDDWLAVIQEKYPELADQINIYNGQMLSDQDKHNQSLLENMKSHYEGLDQITQDGTYALYNTTSQCWDTMTVTVDEATGNITGMYSDMTGWCGAYSSELADKVQELGTQHQLTAEEIANATSLMASSTVNADGQMINANGDVVGSLQNVTNHADGTRSGIINLNGTPIRVQCDANGAITDLNEVNNEINRVHDKSFTITGFFKAVGAGAAAGGGFGMIKSAFSYLTGSYATGTDNAKAGLATVAEEGPELIIDKYNKRMALATQMSLVRMQGGEKVIPADMTKKMLNRKVSGGFYDADSSLSQQLINNTVNNYNNSNSNTTNNNGNNINYNLLGNIIGNAVAGALNNNNSNNNDGNFNMMRFAKALNPYIDKVNNKRYMNRRLGNG